MRSCSDQTAFQWILREQDERLASNNPNWKGNFVSHLLPKSFEAYAKILHTIEADYKNIDNPLSEREIAILKIPPCKKLGTLVESLRKERRGPRVKWQTLAQLYFVPFAAEICLEWFNQKIDEPGCWPRLLSGPDEGNLRAEEFSEMLSILRAFVGVQDCFFRFSEIAFITTNRPILYSGALDKLGTFLTEGKYQLTPEYWWSIDHTWCLCSDYDLTFSIVGGSRELVSEVLKNTTLEALEVTPNSRIDYRAPIPR
jgi:hypothetical protein